MCPAGLLIPRANNEQAVAQCWERFVQNDPLPRASVRDVVLASWRRCRSEAVDPARHSAPAADDVRIRQLREQHHQLYDAAQPVLDNLREVLRESGTLIMLSDPGGVIIDLHGDSRARHAGEIVNLAQGGRWMEDVIGTNAIGTAIAAREPVQIYASEHYCLDVKRWTCAAAPVFDPGRGILLGVVDVSGVKETFHGHSLGLVIAAARQIESVIARQEMDLQVRLLEQSMESFVRYGGDCIVLFDRHGRLVKSNGRLQAAREQHGVHLPLDIGTRIDAFDLGLAPDERAVRAPRWLRPEWLHPVRSRNGDLGTLLVVPLTHMPAPAHAAPRTQTSTGRPDPFVDVIGDSEVIDSARRRARRLATLDLPVMLLGETGVGKEVFARAIHQSGPKSAAPFVAVNCGALTRELLASELFGYAEGAFTGARRGGLAGKFEQADGGTLFLDEIGEMPLDMQPHLLRVLQDGIVVRLGDTRERHVTVRMIAATNRDLKSEVVAGRFREDLYHRLCVTTLRLPALRERPGDIDLILDHLNARLAAKYGCLPRHISRDVRAAFRDYRWPGNVREFQNVFESVFALSEGDAIDASLLPDEIRGPAPAPEAATNAPTALPCSSLENLERQAIYSAVANAKGNISRAAKLLGISRSTLYVKLANLRIQIEPPAKRH
ncbi:sigma-54-dependent Fis family transcriptional regulator [Azoarcus sp. KH32C]|uniref:sigma-54-dependent Fis family transcriptional regulator n=1 Tax=Azoarcus sp. KH32C TaxID=748247 RepID=UPI0002385E82|nr:sigma-54-dependent Fis family transcriptional regulator [Azoarcus sp. KH32C]BAL22905.1 GAF modulated sigma-54 specific transcriptional regulator, Fis family [Azoarcus sp. KH32C]